MDAAYGALLVVLAPWALGRVLVDAKSRSRWRAYLRDLPLRLARRAPRAGTAPCVWVHGVSVGEIKAASRLVSTIEAEVPGIGRIVTRCLEKLPENRFQTASDLGFALEGARAGG